MIDPKLIREKSETVKINLKRRKDDSVIKNFEKFLTIDKKRRPLIKKLDDFRMKRNKIVKEISILKSSKKSAKNEISKSKKISKQISNIELKLQKIDDDNRKYLMLIPNLLHESVPQGKDESENIEIRRKFLKYPGYNKPEQKSHSDVLRSLGLLDLENAAKISGKGFYFLKGKLAILEMALQRFVVDNLVSKGFLPVKPPFMLRRESYEGVVPFKDFENVMYKSDDDLYLIATSEHPLTAMYMKQTIPEDELPIKLVGISECFRKEVGTSNKYTKGLFRVHNFSKIEQVIICKPEDSWKYHEELQKNIEDIMRTLGIPYRVVNVCSGDIGDIAAKKYDTEFLMADGEYREIGSNSNCTDYQARRLGIKYKEKKDAPAKGFVHTLNSTALPISRALVALVEQYQDGNSVKIPKILQSYCGFDKLD